MSKDAMKGSKTHYILKPSDAKEYFKNSQLDLLYEGIMGQIATSNGQKGKSGQGVFLFNGIETKKGKLKVAFLTLWSLSDDKNIIEHFQTIEIHLFQGELPEAVLNKLDKPGLHGKWERFVMTEPSEQPEVIQLKNKCWQLIEILRSEIISPYEYTVALYLISLYRNQLDLRIYSKDDRTVNVELPSVITGEKVKALPDSILNALPQIHNSFKTTLEKLSFRTLEILMHQLRSIDRVVMDKHFGLIFDDLTYRINNYLGKSGGADIQPLELSRFVGRIASLKTNSVIYNPFAGLASFAVFLGEDAKYLGQEINQTTCSLGLLRIFAHNLGATAGLIQGDSISDWNPRNEKYDLIVANPPFNMRLQHEVTGKFGIVKMCDSFFIEKGLDDLKEDGKLIAIVPNRFLSSPGAEQRLRQHIIENDLAEMVISLPSGILPNTGIAVTILVLNKAKKTKGHVWFIDASNYIEKISSRERKLNDFELFRIIESGEASDSIRIASNESMIEAGYNLAVPRYFAPVIESDSQVSLVPFEKLVTVIRGEKPLLGIRTKFVRIRDLKEDRLDYQLAQDACEVITVAKQQQNSKLISESCLLLAVRWQSLKPTYFKYTSEPILISQDIIALKVDEAKVDIAYLINELNSEYVAEQANTFRTGAVILNLRKEDLLRIAIKLPAYHTQKEFAKSLEEQRAKVKGVIEALASDKKKELMLFERIHGLENEIVEQNKYLRHSLAGPASNLIGSMENIKKIIDTKVIDKVPDLMSLKVSEKHPLTFGQYLEILEKNVKKIADAVSKKLKVENIVESKELGPIDIIEFLEHFTNEVKARNSENFSIDFNYDKEAFLDDNGNVVKTFINGNTDLLRDLFDNLVNNAVEHAFTKGKKERIEIHLMKYDEEDLQNDITILVSNTGKPFPENFTKQDFIRKGSTAGTNGGDGYGGWYINEIIEYFKGNFSIIDETSGEGLPDSDLATSFEINLPILEAEENEAV